MVVSSRTLGYRDSRMRMGKHKSGKILLQPGLPFLETRLLPR